MKQNVLKSVLGLVVVFSAISIFSMPACAGTPALVGVVKDSDDPSSQSVSNVVIFLYQRRASSDAWELLRSLPAVTNADGFFLFPAVDNGQYCLVIPEQAKQAKGFSVTISLLNTEMTVFLDHQSDCMPDQLP